MTDHNKLMVALIATNDRQHEFSVAVGDIVAMLYELGAQYRTRAHRHFVLTAAS